MEYSRANQKTGETLQSSPRTPKSTIYASEQTRDFATSGTDKYGKQSVLTPEEAAAAGQLAPPVPVEQTALRAHLGQLGLQDLPVTQVTRAILGREVWEALALRVQRDTLVQQDILDRKEQPAPQDTLAPPAILDRKAPSEQPGQQDTPDTLATPAHKEQPDPLALRGQQATPARETSPAILAPQATPDTLARQEPPAPQVTQDTPDTQAPPAVPGQPMCCMSK